MAHLPVGEREETSDFVVVFLGEGGGEQFTCSGSFFFVAMGFSMLEGKMAPHRICLHREVFFFSRQRQYEDN